MYQLYGISNCDTVKKAKKHLELSGVSFEFVDFKKSPPTKNLLKRWKEKLGELPVNKKGRTYRELKEKYETSTEVQKTELIIENSSLIKRPLLEKDSSPLLIGYSREEYDGAI